MEPAPSVSKNTSDKIVIGVSVMDLSNPYYVQIVEGIKQEAALKGIDIILEDSKTDAKIQVASIESFIEKDLDAIIIAALDPDQLEPIL